MGFGTVEKIDKQAKYEKDNGKSKVKLVIKKPKGKQPKNVSTLVKRKGK